MGSRTKVQPTPPPTGPALLQPTMGVLLLSLGTAAPLGCTKSRTRPPDPPMVEPMPPVDRDAPMPDPSGEADPEPSDTATTPDDATPAPTTDGDENPSDDAATSSDLAVSIIAPSIEPTPKDPPQNATVDEKIAFYEKRLELAVRLRDQRKKFVDRLPSIKARLEASENSEEDMKSFERRKQIVEDNYEQAKADIEEIERKLAEIRGS